MTQDFQLEEFEKEIKKLEEEFPRDEEVLKYLIEPTAVDYWRKKLNEEKILFEKMLETKEEEKKTLEEKIKQQQHQIKILQTQIEQMKSDYDRKINIMKEELARKEVEKKYERDFALLEEKLKELQRKNEHLEMELATAKELQKTEKENLIAAHKLELERLLTACDNAYRTINEIETNMDTKIKQLEEEKEKIEKKLDIVESENKKLLSAIQQNNQKIKIAQKKRIALENYLREINEFYLAELEKMEKTVSQVILDLKKALKARGVARAQIELIEKISQHIHTLLQEYKELAEIKDVPLTENSLSYLMPFAKTNEEKEKLMKPANIYLNPEIWDSAISEFLEFQSNVNVEETTISIIFKSTHMVDTHKNLKLKKAMLYMDGEFECRKVNGLYDCIFTLPLFTEKTEVT